MAATDDWTKYELLVTKFPTNESSFQAFSLAAFHMCRKSQASYDRGAGSSRYVGLHNIGPFSVYMFKKFLCI